MYPDLFKIPFTNFQLHSFGVMLVLGFMLAMGGWQLIPRVLCRN